MKTNSNAYCEAFERYALCCIEDADNGADFDDITDCLTYAIERYRSEYDLPSNRERKPNNQDRLADYLQGLPFHFAFANNDILAVYKALHGEECQASKRETIILGWWQHLALMLERIAKRNGLTFN